MEEKALATTKQETNLKAIMRSGEIMTRFAEVVGNQNAGGYISSVLIAVSQSTNLQQCTPNSIISCALRAATMRLSVDPSTGQAYLVPFKGKATLVVGYKGIYQMALRTNKYRFINLIDIYESDVLIEDSLTGNINLKRGNVTLIPGKHRGDGKIVGFLLYFELVSGFSKTFYMTCEECDEHGAKYSKNYYFEGKPNKDSLWHKDPLVMYKKTVMRIGLMKWGYLDPFDLTSLNDEEDETDYIGAIEIRDVTPRSNQENLQAIGYGDEASESCDDSAEINTAEGDPAESKNHVMTYKQACDVTGKEGERYGNLSNKELEGKKIGISKMLKENSLDAVTLTQYERKLEAIKILLAVPEGERLERAGQPKLDIPAEGSGG